MSHIKEILVDFKRCFFPGNFKLQLYDNEYLKKAEDHSLNPASQQELEKVCLSLNKKVPGRILDVGCNSGRPLDTLCRHFSAKGVGLDVNHLAIQKAQQDYPENEFSRYEGLELPLENEGFDHVMMHHVLGHVESPHLSLSEINRVLKVGGTLSIVTPNANYKLWQFPFNIINDFAPDTTVLRYYTLRTLKNLLEQHGFKLRELTTFGAAPTACAQVLKAHCLLRVYAIAEKVK